MRVSAVMRNPNAPHVDFTPFLGMIESNPKFLPSNLDMVLERNGNFLIAEWKRPGEGIKVGQMILLEALARVPGFVVLIITGDTDNGLNVHEVQRIGSDGNLKFVCDSPEELLDQMREWYKKVSGP